MVGLSALHIRHATVADWTGIWRFFATVIAGGDTYTLPPDATSEQAQAYWFGRAMAVYVAELEGRVVGTYCLRYNLPGLGSHVANAGYVVDPACFGLGIGSRLCAHSLDAARAHGFTAMQFNAVVSTNQRAVATWKKHGFSIIGTVPAGYRHRVLGLVDLYIMHRLL
jgi:GNAT superfamily N-acetyltransferase